MKNDLPPETAELSIQAFSQKGYGVAELLRPAPLPPIEIEVAHTLPHDRIKLEMRRKQRGVRKGRLLEVLKPSPERVEPRCKHARVCGGCCWQQLAYPAQLREKQARVQQAFGPNALVRPILPAPALFRYRNKMEFTFSENRGGMRYLGLMIAQAEPYVFNVEECHLAASWVSEVLQKIRAWWEASGLKAYHPHTDEGTLRYVTFREAIRTGQKMVILNVSGRAEFAPPKAQLAALVSAVGEPMSVFLRIHQTKKGTPTHFYEMHLGGPDHILETLQLQSGPLSFKISPASFFQPNTLQAEALYDAALDLLEPLAPTSIYDLYCGTGTLAMAAARRFGVPAVGIELSPQAVLDAQANCALNGISGCRFELGDVGQTLTRLSKESGFLKPDVVIVDPPRAGLDALAICHLEALRPRAILYISCNPLTQAENVRDLERAGYRVVALQPVDQFPHTYHIENIALLVNGAFPYAKPSLNLKD